MRAPSWLPCSIAFFSFAFSLLMSFVDLVDWRCSCFEANFSWNSWSVQSQRIRCTCAILAADSREGQNKRWQPHRSTMYTTHREGSFRVLLVPSRHQTNAREQGLERGVPGQKGGHTDLPERCKTRGGVAAVWSPSALSFKPCSLRRPSHSAFARKQVTLAVRDSAKPMRCSSV